MVQVLNPRYRKLPGDFRARQTAWEGPREGAGLSSFANSEQDRPCGRALRGVAWWVTPEFQLWFYYFLAESP